MNVTYLIGNGFDLGLGLKTKFSDFLPIYIRKKSKDENIIQFRDDIAKSIDNWSDFELQLGKYTKEFGEEQNEVDKFLDQKEDFDLEFFKYLKNEQSKVISFNDEYLKKFVESLYWYDNTENPLLRDEPAVIIRSKLNGLGFNTYNFITFNYTDCLEKIIKQVNKQQLLNDRKTLMYGRGKDKIGEVIHVHGKIGKSPIIGVNDKSQIDNSGFNNNNELTELLIKHEIDANSDQGFERKAISIIENSDLICIYGMSLGDTDNQWWKHLINWLRNDSAHYLIVFDYDEKYIDSERRYRKKKLKIRERFAEFFTKFISFG